MARDYLCLDSGTFGGLYSGEARFRLGFSYNYEEDCNKQCMQAQWHMAGPGWVYPLRFWKRGEGPVAGNVRVGDALGAILAELGPPDFYDPGLGVRGYRFHNFYLAVRGEALAEEIYLVKIPRLPDTHREILKAYGEGMTLHQLQSAFPAYESYYPQVYLATLVYPNGLAFELADGYERVEVYRNYGGERLQGADAVVYLEEDSIFNKICADIRWRAEQEAWDWAPSPDGRVAVHAEMHLPLGNGWGIYVRFNDGSRAQYCFGAGYIESVGPWLNDCCFLYTPASYKETPMAYNVYTRAARPMEEVRGRDVLRGNRPRRAQGGGPPPPESPAMWNDSGFYADGEGKICLYRDEAPSPLTRQGADG